MVSGRREGKSVKCFEFLKQALISEATIIIKELVVSYKEQL